MVNALVRVLRVKKEEPMRDCHLFPREPFDCKIQRSSDCPPLDGDDLVRTVLPAKRPRGGTGPTEEGEQPDLWARASEYSWGR